MPRLVHVPEKTPGSQIEPPNLAVEPLQKILKGEISMRRKKNIVEARSFAEMLEQTEVLSAERAMA